MAKAPNFLLIITDQHRADHLGCYGNKVVKTPSIDRIAENGTRFENFYVATPICMPNRATLMTGRMPSLHGARQNGIPLSLYATTFVEVMRAAGYDTALFGKCHLQSISGNPPTIGMPEPDPNKIQPPTHLREADLSRPDHGRYDQELRSTWHNHPEFELALPYYGFSHVELAVGHGDQVVGHYERWLTARHPNAESLRGRQNQLPGNDYIAHPDTGRVVSNRLRCRAYDQIFGKLLAHGSVEAIFHPMLIPRSASPVHAPRAILAHVRP
jgi:arylsulfatase A-like enzyme